MQFTLGFYHYYLLVGIYLLHWLLLRRHTSQIRTIVRAVVRTVVRAVEIVAATSQDEISSGPVAPSKTSAVWHGGIWVLICRNRHGEGWSNGQGNYLHVPVIIERHHAGFFVNARYFNVILPLAFTQDVIIVLGWYPRLGGNGNLEEHLAVAKDGHDAIGCDFRRWLGILVWVNRLWRIQTENIPHNDWRIGIIGGHGFGGGQTGIQCQSAREADRDFSNALHDSNIPFAVTNSNTGMEI
jgi:hypothetical protein